MTKVYLGRYGKTAHLLSILSSANDGDSALCGRSPFMTYWLGTGSQCEEERAAGLPICKRCVEKAELRGFEVPR